MPYKDKQEVMQRVIEHYNKAVELGYDVVGVFLQGSWNYELGYEGSDVDTKAIVLPSFEDFVLQKKPVSKTHVMENNEHLDIKDIRVMFDCFKKQNINFIEILFTDFKVMNPEYEDFYKPMFEAREKIAHYDNYAAVNCIVGMMYEKAKAMEHPYPTILDKIEKFGYDPKQVHHIIRCADFLEKYIGGKTYKECLIPRDPKRLIEVKKGLLSLEEARRVADFYISSAKEYKEDYFANVPFCIDKEVEGIMNQVLFKILKHSFSKSFNKI